MLCACVPLFAGACIYNMFVSPGLWGACIYDMFVSPGLQGACIYNMFASCKLSAEVRLLHAGVLLFDSLYLIFILTPYSAFILIIIYKTGWHVYLKATGQVFT